MSETATDAAGVWATLSGGDRASGTTVADALSDGRCGHRFSRDTARLIVCARCEGGEDVTYEQFAELCRFIDFLYQTFSRLPKQVDGRTLGAQQLLGALETSGLPLTPQAAERLMALFDIGSRGGVSFEGYLELCIFVEKASGSFCFNNPRGTAGQVAHTFDTFVQASAYVMEPFQHARHGMDEAARQYDDSRKRLEDEISRLRAGWDGALRDRDATVAERDAARRDLQQRDEDVARLRGQLQQLKADAAALKAGADALDRRMQLL